MLPPVPLETPWTMDIPLLVAHRGYMEAYPENSLRGLAAALQAGAPYVEFDVQSSADGELLILHDTDLLRTAGRPGQVLDTAAADLRGVSVHEPGRFGDRFLPTPIPRLAEIVPLLHHHPDARALVEIKNETLQRFGRAPVVERLLTAIAPVAGQCHVIGYDREILAAVRERAGMPIGWVIRRYDDQARRQATALDPDLLIGEVSMFPPDRRPWPGPWRWMLFDITDPELALAYAADGVELIETRDIGAMYRHPLLARRRLRSPGE